MIVTMKTLARCLLAVSCGAVAVVPSLSCARSTTRGVETAVAKALISSEQENKIGLQVKQGLETKQNIVYMTDPEVVAYVRGVADKVIQFGKRDRPDVQWQVHVIDDRKTVNAFATPGGYLYVFRGLVEMAENEAELAGVMAHETGHVVARHSARSLVAAYGLEGIAALASGNNPGLLTQLTTGIAAKGLLMAHTRADETEADEFGARYTSAAGYDPHGLLTFFQRLKKKEGDTPGVLVFLSDHPATQDRIDYLNRYIAQKGLAGSDLGAEPYTRIRRRLSQLPVATASPAGAPPGAPPGAAPPALTPSSTPPGRVGGGAPAGAPPATPAGAPPSL